MAQNFRPCDRDQSTLLPPSINDWLPGDHLARFVVATTERLDLSAIYAGYNPDGEGRSAYEPAMMSALLLYAYALGIRSSRKIEEACTDSVAFRFITANAVPDHVTINRFRERHAEALAALFSDVLALCAKAGLVDAQTIAIDGTKLGANASVDQSFSEAALRAEAERILGEAARIDAEEDELYGDKRGNELPPELADPKTRGGRIEELIEELQREREQAEASHAEQLRRYEQTIERTGKRPTGRPPSPELPKKKRRLLKGKINVTDPDSAIVSDKGALIQGYNAQAAVADGQIIVAARVTSDANDARHLAPMSADAAAELEAAGVSEPIETVLADGAYWNNAHMDRLQAQGVETVIPTFRNPNTKKAPKQGPHAERIDRLLETDEGKAKFRRRQQIVEPVFANIKYLRGITRFHRRGKPAVEAEWRLIATTHNLLKLFRHAPLVV